MVQTGDFNLDKRDVLPIVYHDIFNYPLTLSEIIKWKAGRKIRDFSVLPNIENRQGYYFIQGRARYLSDRIFKQRTAKKKLVIAKKASRLLSFLPFIKMVAVSGALAMENAERQDDIDLLLITKKGTLWLSRAFSLFSLKLFGFKLRRYGNKNERDKLCLNMWFDESNLVWRKRNIYTAHEIAQIIPLMNKDKSYEKFILANGWIEDYWPNAIKIRKLKNMHKRNKFNTPFSFLFFFLLSFFESLAYRLQKWHMHRKVTKEVILSTRAIFHPIDKTKQIVLQFNHYYKK